RRESRIKICFSWSVLLLAALRLFFCQRLFRCCFLGSRAAAVARSRRLARLVRLLRRLFRRTRFLAGSLLGRGGRRLTGTPRFIFLRRAYAGLRYQAQVYATRIQVYPADLLCHAVGQLIADAGTFAAQFMSGIIVLKIVGT